MKKEEKKEEKLKNKRYIRPEIKEVWDENIGMSGVYLLEMD